MSQNVSRQVFVPASRVVRWFENFGTRHGPFDLAIESGLLHAQAADGERARAALPFGRSFEGPAEVEEFALAVADQVVWGLILARRGGFAVAGGRGDQVLVRKVGRRHVQGKTKAGGWSQQRYSRRRDNQARGAFEAAADHAVRLLVDELTPQVGAVAALVTGGDRKAVDSVLDDPRLRPVLARRTTLHLTSGDPDKSVVDQAIVDALSAIVTISPPAAIPLGQQG